MSARPVPFRRAPSSKPVTVSGEAARALVVTGDADLLDEILRLAGAAGVDVEVSADLSGCRGSWVSAPLVVVGDGPLTVGADVLGRRDNVVVVGLDESNTSVWERAVAVRAEEVLMLPRDEAHLVDLFSEAGEHDADGPGMLVGVVGGRGGAGASTIAAALALSAARDGCASTLLDADPLGGGLDMLLGAEDVGGARWCDLGGARGRITTATLRDALPRCEGVSLLSWDRGDLFDVPAEAMHAVIAASRRGSDIVVVDLPRRFDAAAEVALTCADVTLLVVPAEVRAAAAAARVAAAAGLLTADLQLVVRGPAPAGLPASGIAAALGLPLAGEVRSDSSLPHAAERGEPPLHKRRGALSAFCEPFLDAALQRRRRAA